MAFLSHADFGLVKSASARARILVEAASTPVASSLFLSHSSLDKKELPGVVEFLRTFGARVYVDLVDGSLPASPSPKTAAIIKKRIKSCSRFVILISENSYQSRWIPWELGIADAMKGVSKVGLLPFSPQGTERIWAKQEYLGLYPVIRKRENEWQVHDPRDSEYWSFEDWVA
jgi:hypothetical protein